MSSLKVQSYRHPKTGKPFITEAKLPLSFKGKNVEILINGPDVEVIMELCSSYSTIYVVAEHFKEGGLGTILSDFIIHNRLDVK